MRLPRRTLTLPPLLLAVVACGEAPTTPTTPNTPGSAAIPLEQLETKRIDTLCRLLFTCDATQVPDTSARLLFADEAQCKKYLRDSREFSSDDLSRAVAANLVRYDGAAAQRCMQDLNSCSALDLSEDNDTANCRAVFAGTVALDGACQRSEECAGDTYCATSERGTRCPGTCKARLSPGSTCVVSRQCAGSARCVQDPVTFEATCRVVSSGSAVGEGAACGVDSATSVDTPCSAGLYCHNLQRRCLRPTAVGMPCDGGDRCADGAVCAGEGERTCAQVTIVRAAGAACDQRVRYCGPVEGLECSAGMCTDDGEPGGALGARCGRSDYARACNAGLFCGGATGARTCQTQLALGQPCADSDACAEGSCVDGTCAARACGAL